MCLLDTNVRKHFDHVPGFQMENWFA